MKRFHNVVFFITLCFASFSAVQSFAVDFKDAQENMKERLPAIDDLKMSGSVGENRLGFLEARSTLDSMEKSLLENENSDREILYKAVAERTNQKAEEIGVQRAIRIAELSKAGVWIQRPNGDWFQK